MSRKTSAARRAAFMAAVAATGNQTLACERARVSQSWVTLHRASDPAFRAELEAAIAAFRASFDRLGTDGGDGGSDRRGGGGDTGGGKYASDMRPGRGWRVAAGEELVFRGGRWRRPQIARARLRQWTPRVETRFLEVLAEWCNVKTACAAVGLTPASAYAHRRRWAAFERAWDAALEEGYSRITAMLLESALHGLGATDAMPTMPVTFDDGLQQLRLHRYRVHGFKTVRKQPRYPR